MLKFHIIEPSQEIPPFVKFVKQVSNDKRQFSKNKIKWLKTTNTSDMLGCMFKPANLHFSAH
jgi:hypothetical protein